MSATPTVGVLALQGDTAEHLRVLGVLGVPAVPVLHPEDLDRVDGLILPGGESTTMSKLAARYDLVEPLRKHIGDGMPAYGTCAGMILLADRILDGAADQQTLGGLDITARRNAFGRQTESFEAGIDVDGVGGDPFEAVFIRAPWVESVGERVRVLGQIAYGERAGRIVAVRQGGLLATSFHPELTGDPRIHRLFVDMVKGQA
ncbi:pyridoxal 5'-phosphate synthase glutaminase subunit PdxT [Streptomonospora wellingtoniae]|uniref:Pyridoxal 5'-phosphate synthase subunit PdxT n=1 Tax=Streptomonospora wellingtoniae TaxID=3075544 RepID=A0ABU2KVJ3_9ACTN|nr:pyridoxal 5'-phosphate synthase glutaminase subunit PdxT [Streptomonospora sp. DSM 45055]MDT0303314.1 pyridoxal 5'-phosphate synthase glutaminase subunit PdxT [Streptomonospora sp. DSM 45055]